MSIKKSFTGAFTSFKKPFVPFARRINVLKAEEKRLLLESMETAVEESTLKKVDSDGNVLHESSKVVARSCRDLGLDERGRRRYEVTRVTTKRSRSVSRNRSGKEVVETSESIRKRSKIINVDESIDIQTE